MKNNGLANDSLYAWYVWFYCIRTVGRNKMTYNVSESKIHMAIAQYLNMVIKSPSRWHTVEVSNQQAGKAGMFKQMALKRKNVVTGWPDIEIFWRTPRFAILLPDGSTGVGGGILTMIFLEVKTPDGKLTDKQLALHQELRNEGNYVYIVRSVDDVQTVLKELGVI